MYFFIKYETIVQSLLYFGIEVGDLSSFEQAVLFIIGNLFYLITLYIIINFVLKIFRKFLRVIF